MPITIDTSTDKFFISICSDGVHSFVMLGTYKGKAVTHLLCRVGKKALIPAEEQTCLNINLALGNFLFRTTPAIVVDEGISREKRGMKPISYEAYDISYTQYCEFLMTLESMQTESNNFACYKPIRKNGSQVGFEYTSDPIYPKSKERAGQNKGLCDLSIRNTCRHGAMQLIESIIKLPRSSMPSSYFFVNLLNTSKLEHGVPTQSIPFYVLPTPPSALNGLSEAKKMVAVKLFSRMEKLLQVEPYAESTQTKFDSLKELYEQVANTEKNLSVNELLDSIHTWKAKHRQELETLRKTYFWDEIFYRKTATLSMIENIEYDLPQFKG